MSELKTEQISVPLPKGDERFDAYLAQPAGPARGGIVVLQEIFGVNADIRGTADWLAGEGYMALAPDLFWRQERNVSLTDGSEAEWQKAFALMTAYDAEAGVADIQASIDALRARLGQAGAASQKVGTLGFCLGGKMVYLAACRTDGDAHASYYGVGIQDMLAEAQNITAPTLLHIAGQDEFVPPEAQAAIRAGLEDTPLVETHIYAAQDHAFARNGGMHFDADAARLAHGRSLALFQKALG